MEFEYRLISEKRCNEIDSWQIKDPYGYGYVYTAEREFFVTNEDESILFCHAFMPRHDDRTNNGETYMIIINKNYFFTNYNNFEVCDKEMDGIEYRFEKIEIIGEKSIDENSDKEKLLNLLKTLISVYESNFICNPYFNKQYHFDFFYKGEKI